MEIARVELPRNPLKLGMRQATICLGGVRQATPDQSIDYPGSTISKDKAEQVYWRVEMNSTRLWGTVNITISMNPGYLDGRSGSAHPSSDKYAAEAEHLSTKGGVFLEESHT